jgi:hypothetical protein
MLNPYVVNVLRHVAGEPIRRDGEAEAIREGIAVQKANGFRVRRKNKYQLETKAVRREAAA